MTGKQFTIFMVAFVCVSMVLGGRAQTFPIAGPAVTSLTQCTWPPTTSLTVASGLAICPLNLSTGPAIAIAVNEGPFVLVPMAPATAGVTSFNGRTGPVTLTKADVTGTSLTATTTLQ